MFQQYKNKSKKYMRRPSPQFCVLLIKRKIVIVISSLILRNTQNFKIQKLKSLGVLRLCVQLYIVVHTSVIKQKNNIISGFNIASKDLLMRTIQNRSFLPCSVSPFLTEELDSSICTTLPPNLCMATLKLQLVRVLTSQNTEAITLSWGKVRFFWFFADHLSIIVSKRTFSNARY